MMSATTIATKTLKRDIKTSLIPSLIPLRLYSIGQRVYTEQHCQDGANTVLRQDNYIIRGWIWVDPSALVRNIDAPFLEAGYHYTVAQYGSNHCQLIPESRLKPIK